MEYKETIEIIRDAINADVKKVDKPVIISRSELENLGKEAMFEYEMSDLEKKEISGHWYGLYEFFTVPTQHCYCTKEDLYYILGMVKYVEDLQGKSVNTFYSDVCGYAIDYAIRKEYEHMKLVYKDVFGVEWSGDKEWDGKENDKILAKEINKKVSVCNYFYYYRMYIYNMTYYEMLLGLK